MKKNDQLTSIYQTLQREDGSIPDNIPDQDTVSTTDRWNRVQWDPVESLDRFEGQTDESFDEQKLVVSIATRLIKKYCQEFGQGSTTFTTGNIIHGAPGSSGKSHVIQYLSLYAISLGLQLMTTTLMATQANMLGSIHFHQLLAMTIKNMAIRTDLQSWPLTSSTARATSSICMHC